MSNGPFLFKGTLYRAKRPKYQDISYLRESRINMIVKALIRSSTWMTNEDTSSLSMPKHTRTALDDIARIISKHSRRSINPDCFFDFNLNINIHEGKTILTLKELDMETSCVRPHVMTFITPHKLKTRGK